MNKTDGKLNIQIRKEESVKQYVFYINVYCYLNIATIGDRKPEAIDTSYITATNRG
jgi:hypothetical protein